MKKNIKFRALVLMVVLSLLFGSASAEFAIDEQVIDELVAVDMPADEAAAVLDEDAALQAEMEMLLADVQEMESIEAEGESITDKKVINILLIGTDERNAEFSENSRGDTCILCSVNTKTGDIKLISFERALGVEVLDGEHKGEWDWLTHTFRYGGAELMVREISDHFNVNVDKYVRINFHIFMELVDAVGGVDIELTKAEADYINGPDGQENARDNGSLDELQVVQPGLNHLNGATALVYARCRKIDSDWTRVERQRNVITAAMNQLMASNAGGMVKAVLAMLPMVETNITLKEAISLASIVPKLGEATIEQTTVPVKGTYGSKRGMEGRIMYSVDFNANAKIINDMLYGE